MRIRDSSTPEKSRDPLIDSSMRGSLVFSKSSLLDETTGRHLLPDVVRELNNLVYTRGNSYAEGVSGPVYTRDYIRHVQLGRQYQRMN